MAGLVYGFGYLALGYRLSGDLLLLKAWVIFLYSWPWWPQEVVKANVAIIRIVLSTTWKSHPVWCRLRRT